MADLLDLFASAGGALEISLVGFRFKSAAILTWILAGKIAITFPPFNRRYVSVPVNWLAWWRSSVFFFLLPLPSSLRFCPIVSPYLPPWSSWFPFGHKLPPSWPCYPLFCIQDEPQAVSETGTLCGPPCFDSLKILKSSSFAPEFTGATEDKTVGSISIFD